MPANRIMLIERVIIVMKTTDLEKMLMSADEFDEEIIKANPAPEFYELIDEMLQERDIKRADLIKSLNLDRTYGYQILNGTRMPTKNQIICIGLYLGVTVEQMQQLLRICGRESLYIRNIEDAKVMYALEHKYSYEQAMEFISSSQPK